MATKPGHHIRDSTRWDESNELPSIELISLDAISPTVEPRQLAIKSRYQEEGESFFLFFLFLSFKKDYIWGSSGPQRSERDSDDLDLKLVVKECKI